MKRQPSPWSLPLIACTALGGCGASEAEHARWLAERKAEQAGYHIEYRADRKLLSVRLPNGDEDRIDVSKPKRLYLYRLLGKDAEGGQEAYLWMLSVEGREASVPYFAIDPRRFLSTIAPAMPGVDSARAQARVEAFERGEFEFCAIWAPSGTEEIRPVDGYRVCPPGGDPSDR